MIGYNLEEYNVIVAYFMETLNICYKHYRDGPGRVANIHLLPNEEFDENVSRKSIDCVKRIISKGLEAIDELSKNPNCDSEVCKLKVIEDGERTNR